MPTRCFLIEPAPELQGRYVNRANGETHDFPWQFGAGAMWSNPYPADWAQCERSGVPPAAWKESSWYVRLPNGAGTFCLDELEHKYDAEHRIYVYGNHWQWSGEPPNVTVTPSINAGPAWHGHLQNGVLTP